MLRSTMDKSEIRLFWKDFYLRLLKRLNAQLRRLPGDKTIQCTHKIIPVTKPENMLFRLIRQSHLYATGNDIVQMSIDGSGMFQKSIPPKQNRFLPKICRVNAFV